MLVQTLAIKSRLNLLPLKFHRLAIEKGAVCLGISVSSSAGPAEGELIGKLVTREQNKGTWDLSELSCLSYVWGPTGLNNAHIRLQTSQKSDICTYTASV